jgi:hypothetical protein
MIEAGPVDMHRPDGKARVQVAGRSQPLEQRLVAFLLTRSAMEVRRAAVRRAFRRNHSPTHALTTVPHATPRPLKCARIRKRGADVCVQTLLLAFAVWLGAIVVFAAAYVAAPLSCMSLA